MHDYGFWVATSHWFQKVRSISARLSRFYISALHLGSCKKYMITRKVTLKRKVKYRAIKHDS